MLRLRAERSLLASAASFLTNGQSQHLPSFGPCSSPRHPARRDEARMCPNRPRPASLVYLGEQESRLYLERNKPWMAGWLAHSFPSKEIVLGSPRANLPKHNSRHESRLTSQTHASRKLNASVLHLLLRKSLIAGQVRHTHFRKSL